MRKLYLLTNLLIFSLIVTAQNVGIGTNTPLARLHVVDSSVLFSLNGPVPFPATAFTPISGAGRRMMWFAERAAFRVGSVDDDKWDRDNIGLCSFAGGNRTMARGNFSFAFGDEAEATGSASLAIGNNMKASGPFSVALGFASEASGYASIALGQRALATGINSVAIGNEVHAAGKGSFFFGDSDPWGNNVLASATENEMAMRFNGGYWFASSDQGHNYIGVRVPAGGNSWSSISDVKRKENFMPVNGESFLQKISNLNLTSWNYIGQDKRTFRHYGPMAQDFFAAFGKDDHGTIGCDTLINQQDFLGVNLIAIQALEKRTADLKTENDELKKKNSSLEARLEKLEKLIANKK